MPVPDKHRLNAPPISASNIVSDSLGYSIRNLTSFSVGSLLTELLRETLALESLGIRCLPRRVLEELGIQHTLTALEGHQVPSLRCNTFHHTSFYSGLSAKATPH